MKESKHILLECPFCKSTQKQRFKDGRTVDLYCHCNVNAYMYLSLKKDQYIKYGYVVSDMTPFYTFKFMNEKRKQDDKK